MLSMSSIDRRLIRAAARYDTPEQMSEYVMRELSPAQCLDRVNELLKSKSQLDEVQERRLLVLQIAEHLDWLKENRGDKDTWASISRMYKLLSDQIERTNVNVEDVSVKLAEAHATFFTEGFLLGFNKVLDLLRDRNIIEGELDEAETLELVQAGVSESSEYLKGVTAREMMND